MICNKCKEKQYPRIEIVIDAQDEDETPEQSEQQTGSAPGYAKAVRGMMDHAQGKWGWCAVTVTVKLVVGDHVIDEETNYLGNCSYESVSDFIMNSGYYKQMCQEALKELTKRNM